VGEDKSLVYYDYPVGSLVCYDYPPPIILFDKSGFNYKIWWLLLLLLTVTQILQKRTHFFDW